LIRSMTGFGRGEHSEELGRMIVELKAVNHRFSEVVFRMPRQLGVLEDAARKIILKKVSRGRVEAFVTYEAAPQARGVKVDKDLAMAYYYALKELGEEIESNSKLSLDTLVKLPDVLKVEEGEVAAERLWPTFEAAVQGAVQALLIMREREGASLQLDLLDRAAKIEAFALSVAERSPQVVFEYQQRLQKRLEELLPGGTPVDPQRLAQEVALFADRCDITEETQRLSSHIDQFRHALYAEEPVGRKLDFLVQEIGREINTIGSKANDAALTSQVVEAKSELEKIREQVQNIE
jgi:uncharacterized protein (TIGR00255 family)